MKCVCLGNLCRTQGDFYVWRRGIVPRNLTHRSTASAPHRATSLPVPHTRGHRGQHTEGRSTIQGAQLLSSRPRSLPRYLSLSQPPQTLCSDIAWWGEGRPYRENTRGLSSVRWQIDATVNCSGPIVCHLHLTCSAMEWHPDQMQLPLWVTVAELGGVHVHVTDVKV